jgi:hypothetical protein
VSGSAHHGTLSPLELVAAAEGLPLVALAAVDLDQVRGPVAAYGGLDPGRELRLDHPGQGKPGQVMVPRRGDRGAGLQRRHLAVAGIEQPAPTEQGAGAAIQGEVQRVVVGVAGMDVAGQVEPGGLGHRGHQLELG